MTSCRFFSLVAVAMATPALGQGPSMFRGDLAHTGVYSDSGLPSVTKVKWRVPTHRPGDGGPDVFRSSPAVWHGAVYFGSGDGNIYALDAVSGHVKWKFHTRDVVHASPAIAGGTVYIGSWDSWFYALDAATGALKWRFKTGEDP